MCNFPSALQLRGGFTNLPHSWHIPLTFARKRCKHVAELLASCGNAHRRVDARGLLAALGGHSFEQADAARLCLRRVGPRGFSLDVENFIMGFLAIL